MKLTFLFLLIGLMQVTASVYSQTTKLSLEMRNAKVAEVLDAIENQSEFRFAYSPGYIDLDREVTVDIDEKTIEESLNVIFAGTNVEFGVFDRHILLYPKEMAPGNQPVVSHATGAQQRSVSGRVTDESGQPLPGVTVVVKGTTQGTVTNTDGNYSLTNIPEDATLQFSFVGMRTQEVEVGNQTAIDVTMVVDAIGIEEVVAVGYGIKKKETLTGAISAIKGEDIVVTKNTNTQNMLTGKISGVRVTQKTSEPGSFNTNFDIRAMGSPLIVIDGISRTVQDFQRLNPNDIQDISVLKDASAAIYGVRAANGVVLVTTQKGSEGTIELNYSGSYSWQIPSGLPATVDAMQYMTLRNEQALHNVNGGSRIFNDDEFEAYRTGEKQSTDWYSLVFSDYAPQTMHNLSANGGNERTTYFVSLGYQYQEGFFKSSDLNYTKYNVRSNISTDITDRLTFDLNLNLVMDQQDRPYTDSWWIIRGFWRQGAHIPAYANETILPNHTMD